MQNAYPAENTKIPLWPVLLGLVSVMVVVLPFKVFELDRYFVPKELALHLVALVGAATLWSRRDMIANDSVVTLLFGFLAWSFVSAIFAENLWLAQRAFGLSLSSVVIFLYARMAGANLRTILVAAAFATVCAAGAGLAQAYGVQSEYFSLNRAPGGLAGNRNFVAHISVIGLPALLYATVTARGSSGVALGSIGGAIVAAALILSRSRAAWLALAACLVVLGAGMLAARELWRGDWVGSRLTQFLLACTVGAALSIALPNRLNWKSDSPYMDSAKGMVEYRKGSGRGRLAQYNNSMEMSADHPILGVGPGNWPVEYVKFAPRNDRSLTADGMTANPWPSSDWIAFVSERGIVPAVLLLGVFVLLFVRSFLGWHNLPEVDDVLARVVMAGTISAVMVVSMLDVTMMLAAPALLIWSVIGACASTFQPQALAAAEGRHFRIRILASLLIVLLSIARSTTQIMAMAGIRDGGRSEGWISGASWDPGSYRINLRTAQLYAARGRCDWAKPYARRAHALFPRAPAPKRILQRCGQTTFSP